MTVHCPKCKEDISESYEQADRSVGIMSGGYYCGKCDIAVGEEDREPLEGDVDISAGRPEKPYGTPASELSGRPGHPGYEEFCCIARSWGYD